MMRTVLAVAVTAALLASPCLSRAEDRAPADAAAPTGPWLGTLTVASDYIFRGLTQTNENPALQGSLEYDDASGIYAGFWGSSISWLSDYSTTGASISSNLEMDFYAGYRDKWNDDLSYDVGLYTYYYPGNFPHGFTRANTTEVYAAITYKFVSLKYSHSLTNAFGFADTKNSSYFDLSANYEFLPTWLLNAHAGHQRIDGFGDAAYTDWKLGFTKNFDKGFAFALAYYDTNAGRPVYTNPNTGHFVGRSTAVATISKNF